VSLLENAYYSNAALIVTWRDVMLESLVGHSFNDASHVVVYRIQI